MGEHNALIDLGQLHPSTSSPSSKAKPVSLSAGGPSSSLPRLLPASEKYRLGLGGLLIEAGAVAARRAAEQVTQVPQAEAFSFFWQKVERAILPQGPGKKVAELRPRASAGDLSQGKTGSGSDQPAKKPKAPVRRPMLLQQDDFPFSVMAHHQGTQRRTRLRLPLSSLKSRCDQKAVSLESLSMVSRGQGSCLGILNSKGSIRSPLLDGAGQG